MKKGIVMLLVIIVCLLTLTQSVLAYEICSCGGTILVGTWHCYSAAGVDIRNHYCDTCSFSYEEYRDCIHLY